MATKPTYEELEQRNKELEGKLSIQDQGENLIKVQRDLSIELSSATDLDKGLKLCVDSAIKASGMDGGGVYLRNKISGAFELLYHQGFSADFVKAVSSFDSDSENAMLVMLGKPIYTQYQKIEVPLSETENQENLSAFAVLPITHHNQVIGCMNIASHSIDKIPLASCSLLETIAAQMGSSIARLQAEEALRKSEGKYRTLFENMAQGVFYQRADGVLIDCNPTLLEMFGLTRDQFMGKSSMDPSWRVIEEDGSYLPGEEHPSMVALRTGKQIRNKVLGVFNPCKGSYVWVSLNAIPLFNLTENKPYEVFVTVHNITERKQREGTLLKSQALFRGLFNNMSSGSAIYEVINDGSKGADYIVKEFNKKSLELEGKPIEQVIGRSLFDLRPTIDDYGLIPVMKKVWETGITDYFPVMNYQDDKFSNYYENYIFKLPSGEVVTIYNDITEQKNYEQALRESEELYRMMFEHAGVSITLTDSETGERVAFNNKTHEILGYTREEYQKLKSSQMDADKNREDIFLHYKQIIKKGGDVFEIRSRAKDGSIRNILSSTIPVSIDGKDYIHGISMDITERKQVEEALRESESFNASLMDNSLSPILVVTPDTSILYVNPALEKLTGYSLEELKGVKVPYPWWADDPRSGTIVERKQSVNEGVKSLEKLFRKKDGEDFWVEINTVPIIQDGKYKYILTNWIDITGRKQADEALRESETRFKALHNASFGGIAIHDKGIVLECNQGLSEMTGYSTTELIGMDGLLLIAEKSRSKVMNNIVTGYEKPYEATGLRKNGEVYPIRLEARNIPYKGKNVRTVEFRDITESKQAEAEREKLQFHLIQAHKMESIGTLAGGIAHDFNNILSPIMIHSEMAMMDLPSDSLVQHNLKEIFKAGERARDMVKQILAFSRKGEGKLIAIKITPILNEVLKMLRSSIPTTIEIKQNLEVESDTVLADPTQIDQIMLNLGTNSAHAMREKGGILEVSLVREELDLEMAEHYSDLTPGSYLKLTVRDSGSGIDDEIMQKIFEPYFTTKQIGEGTGMGLALVHGIVKSYGGDITVESEVGSGTTFNVYLPGIEEEVGSVSEPAVQLPKGSERILFVDDELSAVNAMQPMLENLGYNVTARTSSIEALEAFKDDPNRFDLIITDMTMPELTGKELAREIMAIRSGMPVILCTGFSEQIDEGLAKEMGIGAYLMKPIVMHDMASTIRRVLDKDLDLEK